MEGFKVVIPRLTPWKEIPSFKPTEQSYKDSGEARAYAVAAFIDYFAELLELAVRTGNGRAQRAACFTLLKINARRALGVRK